MKRQNRRNGARLLAVLLCVLLLATLYTPAALAAEGIAVSAPTSLTAHYQVTVDKVQRVLPDLPVQLYKVATVSSDAKFTLTDDFAKYQKDLALNNLDSNGWKVLANTLSSFVSSDGLAPLREGKTNGQGTVTFDGLQTGLYLVTAPPCKLDDMTYLPQSFLVCLPNRNEAGQWMYDVKALPKGKVLTSTDRMVQKVWKDDGQKAKRPEAITVQLMKDKTVFETVTLNEANGWRYLWEDLGADALWQIVEKDVPDGYTVQIEEQGSVFVITNTIEPDRPDTPSDDPDDPPDKYPENPPKTPDDPDNPTPPTPEIDIPDEDVPQGSFDIPDEGVPTGDVPESDIPDIPNDLVEIPGDPVPLTFLPQTGMLWWPVPLLATAGMLCYLFGWLKNRRLGEQHGH